MPEETLIGIPEDKLREWLNILEQGISPKVAFQDDFQAMTAEAAEVSRKACDQVAEQIYGRLNTP